MFVERHLGPRDRDIEQMLQFLKSSNLEELISKAAPKSLLKDFKSDLKKALSETELLEYARSIAKKNKINTSFIGQGYYGCITPSVILRNIFENPAWYTAYTPYQAEISQGRMEALLNFQTMITDLTGMPMANSSLLDEATAAAEAMSMAYAICPNHDADEFFVDRDVFPQTREVLETRAAPLNIKITDQLSANTFGVFVQYPASSGQINDITDLVKTAHAQKALVIVATDLLSLTLYKSPGEMGADLVVGSSQRFGVPMGYGGPHAGFLACRDEHKRLLPGRIIGVSKDVHGNRALRLALQTREQHIRREKATSNICTAQVLLAVMASMYAVYHGPDGLLKIASRIRHLTSQLKTTLKKAGLEVLTSQFFDTLQVRVKDSVAINKKCLEQNLNVLLVDSSTLQISLDETTTESALSRLLGCFDINKLEQAEPDPIPPEILRTKKFLEHPVFNEIHSETEMLRYMMRLQSKDLSLVHSMIPLGSCTMKLNSTTEMIPVTWPEFANLHPFAPLDQARGYLELIAELEQDLCDLTGFSKVSLQPNAGSQGEYAGLLVIKAFHHSKGQTQRNVCLIPSSAHGTNPASSTMVGMKVVVVRCDDQGNIDIADLKQKAELHKNNLAALMVTYPSTHGVFEEHIGEICKIIHDQGGQVYMDGANMNALVGLIRPFDLGADVAHMNLHKTFCIPHGGGGPGVGPIGVAKHLAPFLPSHRFLKPGAATAVTAAPFGSASILPISWAYIRMMGFDGLKKATQVAILNANYIAQKLKDHFPLLYTNGEGFVAHECIFDLRDFKSSCGITVDDVAKRLMDYGFHAPTMSWPVTGTLMVEPTESESKAELDRFIEAMISIRKEIAEIESDQADRENNVLKNSPHTLAHMTSSKWDHPYSREKASSPLEWVSHHKLWATVGRVDNVYGDKNLVCSCLPVDSYS